MKDLTLYDSIVVTLFLIAWLLSRCKDEHKANLYDVAYFFMAMVLCTFPIRLIMFLTIKIMELL